MLSTISFFSTSEENFRNKDKDPYSSSLPTGHENAAMNLGCTTAIAEHERSI